jgi:hypothetical protein
MMLAYNADGYIRLFLLFKVDFAGETEYRPQIKTFRLKYIFLAGKIIRTARSVVMKKKSFQMSEFVIVNHQK